MAEFPLISITFPEAILGAEPFVQIYEDEDGKPSWRLVREEEKCWIRWSQHCHVCRGESLTLQVGARFCPHCGAQLEDPPRGDHAKLADSEVVDGDR